MASRIRKCPGCQRYTLLDICRCKEKTAAATPPKYSPLDKYAHYRRIAKEAVSGGQT